MPRDEPTLLEVVPWSYGFAHSWALAWLLESEAAESAILSLVMPEGRTWRLVGRVAREESMPDVRADLFFTAEDEHGGLTGVVVETKVADDLKPEQLEGYSRAGHRVVLYVPGLTGLLMGPSASYGEETWLSGADLSESLRGLELPAMVAGYVDAVAAEATRMDDARAFVRGERLDPPAEGQCPSDALLDTAWLVEVAAELGRLGEGELVMRSERNDRGLFWAGAYRDMPGAPGAGPYVDVLADRRTHRRAVALKTGGEVEHRLACYDAVRAEGPPAGGDRWSQSRRSPRGGTMSIWRADVTGDTPRTAARLAVAARDLGAAVAERG